MKIIHYTLGLPPFRNGGLVNYSLDLAREQSKDNEVILLYPGRHTINQKVKIKCEKKDEIFRVFSIMNPLPLSIMKGIKNPKDFMKKNEKDIFEDFLRKERPDIVHIHTLMGLPKEFIQVCNYLKIKTVFTTHDYFGICPKVNLVDENLENCLNYQEGEKCIICNRMSEQTSKLKKYNSYLYIKMRENKLLNKYKGFFKIIFKRITPKTINKLISDNEKIKSIEYKGLRNYYLSILNLVDIFHFNSNISKKIYTQYLKELNGEIVFITHRNLVKDINFKKEKNNTGIKIISFLGNENPIKGLGVLLEAFEMLSEENKSKLKLRIYGVEKNFFRNSNINIEFKGTYNHTELKDIFRKTDYTIIPSLWYETFNFVALESKIYETPVIISETIGAKDIFRKEDKIEIKVEKNFLKNILEKIAKNEIKIDSIKIENHEIFQEHAKKIIKKLYT